MRMSGVILAGGNNRRMGGRPKALLPFPDRPILDIQLTEMARCCDELIVVTNPSAADAIAQTIDGRATVLLDAKPGLGPLGGLYTALKHCKGHSLWLAACDMPYISAEAAQYMAERMSDQGADYAVPVEQGRQHPLHGVYSTGCLAEAERLLAEDRLSMSGLLSAASGLLIPRDQFDDRGIAFRFTMNINTPDEYAIALPSQDA